MNWKEVLIAVACSTLQPWINKIMLSALQCAGMGGVGGGGGLCDRKLAKANAQIGRFELNMIACL